MISTQKAVDPTGFRRLATAAEANSRVFRDAAASTGLFETQQVRVNSATDEYVKKLNAQKMSFREMMKARKVATAAYREQLAMENMMVRKNPASSMHGKDVFDVVYPNAYEKSVNNAGNRLRWFNAQLKSGAHQMVNWGKNTQWSGRQLMVGFTMPIAAFGAAAGVMAYQVDKEFTRIAKVYDTTADRLTDLAGWEAEVAQLRADGYETARVAARDYQAAITDTLQVQSELAATGFTGQNLQDTTKEIMRIATLGEIDPQQATGAAIALKEVWGQTADEAKNTFNYMNAIENATSLTADDFTAALPVASAAVKAFGGDVKELGILLTAMRERGINASEGANALKATMQRLSRPSKQIKEEFAALTGESIEELVDSSSSLTEIFTKLNAITANLDQNAKRDVFAGLFGSYQVARMTALTEGMAALEAGTGQVSAAARVAAMDTEDLAEIAQGEIEALQQSVSGQFKSALEEVKIVMAEMGLPFLKAATTIVKTLAEIGNWINNLPDGAKTFLGWTAALAALAGPVVMMTGLFANLAGNGIKFFAGMLTMIGKFTGSMTIADKQTRIYAAAAKMAESDHLKNTRAVESLTATMEKLVAAQRAATTASQKEAMQQRVNIKLSEARKKIEDERIRQMQIQNRMDQQYTQIGATGKREYRDAAGEPISRAQARGMAINDVDTRNAAHNLAIAEAETRAKAQTAIHQKVIAKDADRHKVAMLGGSIAAAAMAGSMAAMMFSSNETTQNVAQWVMIGTIVVPAAWTLLRAVTGAAMAAGVYAKNMWSGANATKAAAAGTSGSLLGGLKGLITKGNLATLAVAGIATAAYAVWDHFRDIREEQKRIDKANARLVGQTERWANATGKALDGYKQLSITAKKNAATTEMTQRIEFYKSDEEKKATEAFSDMGYMQQQSVIIGKYIDMVHGMGMTTKEAENEIQAFLMATGESALGAGYKMEAFTAALHGAGEAGLELTGTQWASQFQEVMQTFDSTVGELDLFDPMDSFDKNKKYLTELGEQGGRMYAQAFMSGDQATRDGLRESLEQRIFAPYQNVANMIKQNPFDVENLKNAYGETEVNEMLSSGEKLRKFYMSLDVDEREGFRMNTGFAEALEQAEALERTIVEGIAEALGVAGDGVDTLGELYGDAAVRAEELATRIGEGIVFDKTRNEWRATETELEQGISEVGALYEEFMGKKFDPTQLREFEAELTKLQTIDPEDMSDEDKERKAKLEELIVTLYAYRDALNIQEGSSEFGNLINLMGGFQNETDAATNKVAKLDTKLKNLDDVNLTVDVIVNMMQDIRGGIQQDMADMMTEDFDSRMQADQDATQKYWDNRRDALDRQMDNREQALENKYEKQKEQIEKLIEAEEKAEAKRQKMFEAEMERIDRLSEAANRDIDFNVALNEGNLDEAAKIANDVQAEESNFLLDKAADASKEASDEEVERLNKQMDALEKAEKAEKAHLDKVSKMRKDALDAQADAAIEANKRDWENKKKAFDEQMELFLAFTARNDKELKKHMEDVGISYDSFGDLLKNKGTNWSEYMGGEMQKRVRLAALELRNDHVWSSLGEGAILGMINAMGFASRAQFEHFIKTGEMKDLKDPVEGSAGGSSANKGKRQKAKEDQGGVPGVGGAHEGGWAGKTGNNRTGVARTYKGLHPTEVMIRAQHGEYIVDRKNAAKNAGILEAISGGAEFGTDTKRGHGKGGEPLAGFAAGAVMRSLMYGVMRNIGDRHKEAKARAAAAASAGGGGFSAAGFVQGVGGWKRPAPPGMGWSGNTHDYRTPVGTPVYAISDGVITDSRAITSGGSPGNGSVAPNGQPYRSYGETIAMRAADGNIFRVAHLSSRYVGAGTKVKGGALIGRSGNTGNSSGPHLHMDVNGNYNASGYLASRGIPLRDGAAYVRMDNTIANLHHGERVLTQSLTSDMDAAMREFFANGGRNEYTFIVNPSTGMDEEALANKVVRKWKAEEARKPQSRTVGKKVTR